MIGSPTTGVLRALVRRFKRSKDGTAAIEFALILPILLTLSFGIMELSLYMASLVTLEGGLKEASRYGITAQTGGGLSTAQKNDVPTAFRGKGDRTEMIGYILSQHALKLIDLNNATITTQVFNSFSQIKDGEPYTDSNANGVYDTGEPFSDTNCNHTRDGPGASNADSVGGPDNIVVYKVTYDWIVMTPFVGPLLGTLNAAGKYTMPMNASVVVKNEPALPSSSFCS
jgi:Flp pilus assembly protein TadG